jgi:hypothetical protein
MTLKQTLLQIGRFVRETLQPDKTPARRLLVACVVVFTIAVGVRLLHWQNNWLTIDNTMNKTAAGYKKEAQFLTAGDFKSFIRGNSVEPDTSLLTHTPGYPIFIAASNLVTRNSTVALRLVHIALGAAATVLVLLIAAELLPLGAAVFAALLAAISPQLSYYSLVLLPDSITAVPLLIAMYLLVRARKRPNDRIIVGAGVCIGISCWLRADLLLLAPFLCLLVPFLFPRERWLRYMAQLITAFVITIAPITIRNVIVFKSFIPLSLGTGITSMEGIADYDPEKRFGMERYDHEVIRQEALIYNRPDYAEDLFRPDGIGRDRLRMGRAWGVIKANKLWFAGVMARRAGKMLTYESVSIISKEPSVSHPLDISRGELVWHADPSNANAIKPEQITVQRNSDYVLNISLRTVGGRMVIKIMRVDSGKTLASATVPDSLDPTSAGAGEFTALQIPFVNSNADQVKIVVAELDDNSTNVGQLDLYRLGSASYIWTGYPRALAKTFQKFFTTKWMLPLALAGTVILGFARRLDALAVVLVIPLYYISTHAPLHLELRYILPVHYFWAMLVATSLYFTYVVAWNLLRRVKRLPRNG